MRTILFLWLLPYFVFSQVAENLGGAINTEYNETCPVVSPDGKTLYFCRASHPENTSKVAWSNDIWFSEQVSGYWAMARRMPNTINRDEVNTLLSISPDGNTILLKGAYQNGSYQTIGFSLSKRTADGGWGMPEKIDIPDFQKLCKGKYYYGFLSNDGKTLLMSFSEKKNSAEEDLYVSFYEEKEGWSGPLWLGDDINTDDATETTPFLAPDGITLYFSSNRTGGMGSNDVYMCKRKDKSWEKWTKPINLGSSVNTEDYDAYYTIAASNDYAYFLSRKSGGMGKGDIVRLKLDAPTIIAEPVASKETVTPPPTTPAKAEPTTSEAVVLLTGKLFDAKTKKVPANAKIVYENLSDGKELGVASPNPITGEYKIVLPYGKKYGITASIDGYVASSQNIDLSKQKGGYLEITGRDIEVQPIAKGATITLNNIFFEFGKTNLQRESFPELDRVALFLRENNRVKIEVAGHTDNIGSDEVNNRLSQERADAVRTYLLSKNIATERVTAKGYGKNRPKASNETPEGQQQNRRVEFAIL